MDVLVSSGSDDNLLPDSTKPLPKQMLTTGCWYPSPYCVTEKTQDMLTNTYHLKLIFVLKTLIHLSGDKEFMLVAITTGTAYYRWTSAVNIYSNSVDTHCLIYLTKISCEFIARVHGNIPHWTHMIDHRMKHLLTICYLCCTWLTYIYNVDINCCHNGYT